MSPELSRCIDAINKVTDEADKRVVLDYVIERASQDELLDALNRGLTAETRQIVVKGLKS